VAYLLSILLELKAMTYLLQLLFDNALLVVVVIFQPEIRRALEHAGHSRFGNINLFGNAEERAEAVRVWKKAIDAVCGGVQMLQHQKMGALIVFERNTRLNEIVKSGTTLEAEPSQELVGNVFFNKAPLHDGAMIVRDGKVYAAGCILPLTENTQISRELGTRHRAGVGMSENSDAVVLIVSEETGAVSMAVAGELRRGLSEEELREYLEKTVLWERVGPEEKRSFWRWLRKGEKK
ncbi:MAG: diadenylate cyclase CdaA, partial [Clostridia bacterium]|nr:diadenylate cyclase CdaA [Clostridia bacterium]